MTLDGPQNMWWWWWWWTKMVWRGVLALGIYNTYGNGLRITDRIIPIGGPLKGTKANSKPNETKSKPNPPHKSSQRSSNQRPLVLNPQSRLLHRNTMPPPHAAPIHLISRLGDPIFAVFIGLGAAATRINREEKEMGRSTEETVQSGLRRVGLGGWRKEVGGGKN
ncbi:hypothetical protein VTL71DRAFT_2547 [Oculimacula yallundae]|uniref:ATP synthase F0 subunit 8 n=1 Tax=Oculimacula yallundae TaxID=86028 RepID=A0ABR4C984_9HELO